MIKMWIRNEPYIAHDYSNITKNGPGWTRTTEDITSPDLQSGALATRRLAQNQYTRYYADVN